MIPETNEDRIARLEKFIQKQDEKIEYLLGIIQNMTSELCSADTFDDLSRFLTMPQWPDVEEAQSHPSLPDSQVREAREKWQEMKGADSDTAAKLVEMEYFIDPHVHEML